MEGDLGGIRPALEALLCKPRGAVPDNAHPTLPQGCCISTALSTGLTERHCERRSVALGATARDRGRIGYHDVFNAGTGMAKSRVVTRCNSHSAPGKLRSSAFFFLMAFWPQRGHNHGRVETIKTQQAARGPHGSVLCLKAFHSINFNTIDISFK
jgi:hypothetical protein